MRERGAWAGWRRAASIGALSIGAALSLSGCRAGVEAAAYAAAAGAVQLAEIAAEAAARDNDNWTPRPECDQYRQVECYAGPDLTLDEARDRALAVINIAREANHARPLNLDFALSSFAQDGAKELVRNHRPHAHIAEQAVSCPGCDEVQSDPQGYPTAPVSEQLDAILDAMFREGPGGSNHDTLVSIRWHRIGIGVVNPKGPLYLTVDLAP
jgi:hypothetical protein